MRSDFDYMQKAADAEEERARERQAAVYVIKLRALNRYKLQRQVSLEKTQLEAGLDMQLKALNKIKLAQDAARLREQDAEKQRLREELQLTRQLHKGLKELTITHKDRDAKKEAERLAREQELARKREEEERQKEEEERKRLETESKRLEAEKILEEERKAREKQEQQEKLARIRAIKGELSQLNALKVERDLLALRLPEIVDYVSGEDDKWLAPIAVNRIQADRGGIFMFIRSESISSQWVSDFISFSKLGAPNKVDEYIRYSVDGIKIKYLEELPAGMGTLSGGICFQLITGSPEWLSALKEQEIVVYAPDLLKLGDDVKLVITQV